jgi:hypothetical protein
MITELENVLNSLADTPVLDATAEGASITAETRAHYDCASDATVAAHELLAQVLDTGYRLRGGMVGAERCSSGGVQQWRGELVEVFLTVA